MNVHDKLFEAMLKVIEIYMQENGYNYYELAPYDKTCFSKEQFDEMVDLINTEFNSIHLLDSKCAGKCHT